MDKKYKNQKWKQSKTKTVKRTKQSKAKINIAIYQKMNQINAKIKQNTEKSTTENLPWYWKATFIQFLSILKRKFLRGYTTVNASEVGKSSKAFFSHWTWTYECEWLATIQHRLNTRKRHSERPLKGKETYYRKERKAPRSACYQTRRKRKTTSDH